MKHIKLVGGVGINDSDSPVSKYIFWYEDGKRKQKQVWRCKAYAVWNNILSRCYNPKTLSKHPSYIGVSVCTEWLLFSNFKTWFDSNYIEGWELDKDIMSGYAKIYSPDTCCFIPANVNCFLTNISNAKGFSRRSSGRYQAFCSNPFTGKVESLGTYETESEANSAYRDKKTQHLSNILRLPLESRVKSKLASMFQYQ